MIYKTLEMEAAIGAARRVYCPYKDCSCLLEHPQEEGEEDEGAAAEGQAAPYECLSCQREFCGSCRIVGWHQVRDFGRVRFGGRGISRGASGVWA